MATPAKPNTRLETYIVKSFKNKSFQLYVSAALLFRQLTSFIERHMRYWPQGNTQMMQRAPLLMSWLQEPSQNRGLLQKTEKRRNGFWN
jgi:hypothetical protein